MICGRYGSAFARFLETVEGSDFEVEEAADGAEALKFMEKTPADRLPDIILLDRNMPRMSGDACIRILKIGPGVENYSGDLLDGPG